MATTNFI